jgi:PTS system nitrogen regulatory IIA component
MMVLALLASLITPGRVIPHLRAHDIRHVVDAMIRAAAAEASLDRETVLRAVMDRAASSSFGFERGVAIPHARIPGLEYPVGVFARLEPAQDFGASDDIAADLVFLLLSPDGDDPTHLRALACVVRRLRDHEVAARLRSAKDAQAIHVVLTSDTWRGAAEPPPHAGNASAGVSGRDLTNAT